MLRALAICCVLVVVPRSAAAEWHFTPMIGATFFGSTSLLDHELATDDVHRNFDEVRLALHAVRDHFNQSARNAGVRATIRPAANHR